MSNDEKNMWESFELTGKIEDYLGYKGVNPCEYNNSFRNGDMNGSDNGKGNSNKRTSSGGERQVY